VRKQNQDSDLGLDGVPVAIGSGSRESLSAVPSTAAADGTRSMPPKRPSFVSALWAKVDVTIPVFIAAGFAVGHALLESPTRVIASLIGATLGHLFFTSVSVAWGRRAVDREVERLSKGGGV
jgi:hypothetical protein